MTRAESAAVAAQREYHARLAAGAVTLRPSTRAEARECVRAWHSHHKAHVGEIVAIAACVGGQRWR